MTDPERLAFERWLNNGHHCGANENMWKAWLARSLLDSATPADHSPIGWEYYEEGKLIKTYDSVERADHAKKMFGGVVRPIYAQPPQNAADHIEAQSVPVAEMPLTSGAGPRKLAWFKHPDSFESGTRLYAHRPQSDAQSVRDAALEEAAKVAEDEAHRDERGLNIAVGIRELKRSK